MYPNSACFTGKEKPESRVYDGKMEWPYSLDMIFFQYPLYFMEKYKVISKYQIYETAVFLSIGALSGNGTLDTRKDDNGNNMLNPNEEIKQRVEEIRVITNIID